MKAILRYVLEETRAMDLEVLEGWAWKAAESVRHHDRPVIGAQVEFLIEEAQKEGWELTIQDAREALTSVLLKLPEVQKDGEVDWPLVWQRIQGRDPRAPWNGSILPADKRWALV